MKKTILPILFVFVIVSLATAAPSEGQEAAPTPVEVHPSQSLVSKAAEAFQQGDARRSLALFTSASDKHADLPPGQVMFARLAFAAGETKAGRQALEIAALEKPDDPEVWNMLADLAFREGRLAESELLFQQALSKCQQYDANQQRREKQTINAHAGLSSVYQNRQQWEPAKTHLRAWLDLDQRNSLVWLRLAGVFFQLEKYDVAEETLQNLRSFDSAQPVPEVLMGQLFQAAGKTAEAKDRMLQAIADHGEDLETRIAVARWAMAAGEQSILRQCVEAANEIDPDSDAVDVLQGMIQRFAGDHEAAEEIFAELHQRNPASFDAINGLALSMLSQDEPEKLRRGSQHAEMLVKSHPDRKTAKGRAATATYAWALHRNGQTDAAENVIRQVIASGEVSPEVGYFAAAIFETAGELDAARQLVRAAIDSRTAFPQRQQAQALLQRLSD